MRFFFQNAHPVIVLGTCTSLRAIKCTRSCVRTHTDHTHTQNTHTHTHMNTHAHAHNAHTHRHTHRHTQTHTENTHTQDTHGHTHRKHTTRRTQTGLKKQIFWTKNRCIFCCTGKCHLHKVTFSKCPCPVDPRGRARPVRRGRTLWAYLFCARESPS